MVRQASKGSSWARPIYESSKLDPGWGSAGTGPVPPPREMGRGSPPFVAPKCPLLPAPRPGSPSPLRMVARKSARRLVGVGVGLRVWGRNWKNKVFLDLQDWPGVGDTGQVDEGSKGVKSHRGLCVLGGCVCVESELQAFVFK